jgi:hypothetical protein
MARAPIVNGTPFSDFLNPQSMLTPGIAGSLTMLITNTLAFQFGFISRAWIGLALSFLFGTLVFVATGGILTKAVFYILNSLVIFCVAQGTNVVGENKPGPQTAAFSIVAPAFAEGQPRVWKVVDTAQLQSDINALSAQYNSLSQAIDAARQGGAAQSEIDNLISAQQTIDVQRQQLLRQINQPPTGQFFSPWKF